MIGSSMYHFFFEGFLILVCITRDAKHSLILVGLWKTECLCLMVDLRYLVLEEPLMRHKLVYVFWCKISFCCSFTSPGK